MTSKFPSIKRRRFEPYKPYTIESNTHHSRKNTKRLFTDGDVDFNVESSPTKNPRLYEPDELCVLEELRDENNSVKNIVMDDLTTTVKDQVTLQSTVLKIKQEVVENSSLVNESVRLLPISPGHETYYKKENGDTFIDQIDACHDVENEIEVHFRPVVKVKDILESDDQRNSVNNEVISANRHDKENSITDHISKRLSCDETTRSKLLRKLPDLNSSSLFVKDSESNGVASCCRKISKTNNSIVLVEDICLLHQFKYKHFLEKALLQQDGLFGKRFSLKNTSKTHNRVVNVSTDASTDLEGESSSEKIVAKKIENQRTKKLLPPNTSTDSVFKNDSSKSPRKTSPLNQISNKSIISDAMTPVINSVTPTLNYCHHGLSPIHEEIANMRSITVGSLNDRNVNSKNHNGLVSLSIDPMVDDKTDCEALRIVPLHPRSRMKFRNHSLCNRNLVSPTATSSALKSPLITSSITQKSSVSYSESTCSIANSLSPSCVASTPKNNVESSSIYCSTICYCGVIDCSHGKPTSRKRSALNVSLNSDSLLQEYQSNRRNRPSLLNLSLQKSQRSPLTETIYSVTARHADKYENDRKNFIVAEHDYFDVESDSITGSHYSSNDELPNMPLVVHISSDTEQSDIGQVFDENDDEPLFLPKIVKTEIKAEDDSINQISVNENDAQSIKHQEKVKTRIKTFVSKPAILPTFLKACDVTPQDSVNPSSGRIIKSVSKQQMIKLTRFFNLERANVAVIKLSSNVIDQLITLCASRENWNDREMLLKAGLSEYDIERLGLAKMRKSNSDNYHFRKFVKKRDVFQSLLQPRNFTKGTRTKNPKRELEFLKSQKRKLKEILLAKQREEKKKKDLASVRRALLKINARFLNQSKFWYFLDQGSSPSKPIEL